MKVFLKLVGVTFISLIFSLVFDMKFVKDNHFNIITVSTVLIGFLFTTLSMLLTFLNERVIQFFEKANCLENVYSNIIQGIILGICSVLLSVMNLILCDKVIINSYIVKVLYSGEIVLLILNMSTLFIVILDFKNLIDSIRIDKQKDKNQQEANRDMNAKFGKHK